jgi:hypothetical protein
MDELIQLALRNWNFSGDPKFAVEFINLFKRSGLETPKTQKGNKIWVVLFNHGHGRDVSVYSSEEEADAASANLVLELLDDDDFDNESLEQEIRNDISTGDIFNAVQSYCENTDYRHDIEIFNTDL